jgi:hypothetical protein
MRQVSAVTRLERELSRAAKRAKYRVRQRSLHEDEHAQLLMAEQMIRPSNAYWVALEGAAGGGSDAWFTSDRLHTRNDVAEHNNVAAELIEHIRRADYVQVGGWMKGVGAH